MTYKVSITCGSDTVIFEASTPIGESRAANYSGHDITHLPAEIFAYKNTASRKFGIAAKIVSRNASEAAANSRYLDLIRSWVLPDFGGSGATPPIVYLSAFYNTNIDKVPCVIKDYNFGYPDDVDWVFDGAIRNYGTGKNKTVGSSAMPVIMTITLNLDEAYSPSQITNRAWKINLSKGGSFVYGAAANDVTALGGGQWIAQQPLSGTPSMIDLTNSSNFTGIASASNSAIQSPIVLPGAGNGNLASTFAVTSSSLITETTPQSSANSPFLSGYNPNTMSTLTLPPPSQPSPSVTPDAFNRNTGYINTKPTSPT